MPLILHMTLQLPIGRAYGASAHKYDFCSRKAPSDLVENFISASTYAYVRWNLFPCFPRITKRICRARKEKLTWKPSAVYKIWAWSLCRAAPIGSNQINMLQTVALSATQTTLRWSPWVSAPQTDFQLGWFDVSKSRNIYLVDQLFKLKR